METKYHFALLGHPIGHSYSGIYLNNKFRTENKQADYTLIDLPSIDRFPLILQSEHWNGFNVTIPHKSAIIPYLDKLSPTAEAIGAVNTIEIVHKYGEFKTIGHNTDVIGFEQTLRPILCKHHTAALILGTGGASKAVKFVLEKLKIRYISVSRSHTNGCIGYKDLTSEIIKSHKIIINCTPLGMFPNTDTCPDVPYNEITEQHLLYDLVYNPEETLFLQQGKLHHSTIMSGLQMLYAQADASVKIWGI